MFVPLLFILIFFLYFNLKGKEKIVKFRIRNKRQTSLCSLGPTQFFLIKNCFNWKYTHIIKKNVFLLSIMINLWWTKEICEEKQQMKIN